MFCLTLEPKHINYIKSLNYTPVVLGEKNTSEQCLSDKIGENISQKNKYYGEYTFHYWLWKNHLKNIKEDWIGFCQYRKFWSLKFSSNKDINITNLKNKTLKEIPNEFENFDVI